MYSKEVVKGARLRHKSELLVNAGEAVGATSGSNTVEGRPTQWASRVCGGGQQTWRMTWAESKFEHEGGLSRIVFAMNQVFLAKRSTRPWPRKRARSCVGGCGSLGRRFGR